MVARGQQVRKAALCCNFSLQHFIPSLQAREGNVRVKTAKGGLAQREALLDSNKHRKQSRKRVSAARFYL